MFFFQQTSCSVIGTEEYVLLSYNPAMFVTRALQWKRSHFQVKTKFFKNMFFINSSNMEVKYVCLRSTVICEHSCPDVQLISLEDVQQPPNLLSSILPTLFIQHALQTSGCYSIFTSPSIYDGIKNGIKSKETYSPSN